MPSVRPLRDLSYWHDTAGDDFAVRPSLPGNCDADVAVVGAGYTGLWTAYYLKRAEPSLRIVVCEREVAGFGASGRNGGWCSALFAGSRSQTARSHGRDAVVAMQRAMFATVDEVGRVSEAEGIDCDWTKAGTVTVATQPHHVGRLQSEIADHRSWGFGADDYRWRDQQEAQTLIGCEPNFGAVYTPHCASVHPAKLVRGLARAVERLGVTIHEGTPVSEISIGRVRTTHGDVRAPVVVRATEGYTASLRNEGRTLLPLYSLMIATEPLSDTFWDAAGLRDRATFADARHLIVYGQRTADGRFAFGGRGAPYHFGSRVLPEFDRVDRVFSGLEQTLRSLFPALRGARITHRWGGPLGVPRDWYSSVGFDRPNGLAWAGGYVGDGVSTTNLAGRTLADLILGHDTDLVRLPWVGHGWPRWEPEPLRWIGINAGVRLAGSIDRAESRGRRPRVRTSLLRRLTHH